MRRKAPSALTDREVAAHPLFNKIQRQEYKKRRDHCVRKKLVPYTALEFAEAQLAHAGRLLERLGDHPAIIYTHRRAAVLYAYEAIGAAGLSASPRGLSRLMRRLEKGTAWRFGICRARTSRVSRAARLQVELVTTNSA